jgi:hypothetical protein
MKTRSSRLGLVLLGALLMTARPARPQPLTDIETVTPGNYLGNGGAQVTVAMSAQLTQAIELTLTGIPDGAATTTIAGAGTAGVVNFGLFSTQCAFAVTNGECVRITSGVPGSFLVASFRAIVRFSAIPSADLGMSRDGPQGSSPPDVLNPRLRWALGLATPWTDSSNGNNMPDVLTAGGENNLGANLASGTAIDHQVALRFGDSAQQAAYSTTVRWTATAN